MKNECKHENVWIEETLLWKGYFCDGEYVANMKENSMEITCAECKKVLENGENEDISDKINFQ